MTGFALLWGRNPGKFIDRVEHAILCCGTADNAFAAEIIPNLSVVLASLLEQSRRTARKIFHGDMRHGAAQFGEGLLFEVETPRVLWREVRFDSQRRDD